MGVEHGVGAPSVVATGEDVETASESPDPTRLDDEDQEQNEDRDRETDERRSDVRRDGCVEVDRSILQMAGTRARRGGPSLAGAPSRSVTDRTWSLPRTVERLGPSRAGAILPSDPDPPGVATHRWPNVLASPPVPASVVRSSAPSR